MFSPRRSPIRSVATTAVLAAVTVLAGLVMLGRVPLERPGSVQAGAVFYVLAYHYGFAFYDAQLKEIDRMEVTEGETVTLHIVDAAALAPQTFYEYSPRSIRRGVGGLPPNDPAIAKKIAQDVELGNLEHIIGIAAHTVYVTTNVAVVLHGRKLRDDGPRTVADAVRANDPTIKTTTFTARKAGTFDVLCVDSGMDGGGTCGWAHKWMVGKGAFVVRPR